MIIKKIGYSSSRPCCVLRSRVRVTLSKKKACFATTQHHLHGPSKWTSCVRSGSKVHTNNLLNAALLHITYQAPANASALEPAHASALGPSIPCPDANALDPSVPYSDASALHQKPDHVANARSDGGLARWRRQGIRCGQQGMDVFGRCDRHGLSRTR